MMKSHSDSEAVSSADESRHSVNYFTRPMLVPFIFILLTGIVLAALLVVVIEVGTFQTSELKFRTQAASIASLVRTRWESYLAATRILAIHVAQLKALNALSREGFREVAACIGKTSQAQVYSYNPNVLHADRASTVANSSRYWQRELNRSGSIFEFKGLQYDENGEQLPGSVVRPVAESYQPVTFIEPVETNEGAVNFDLLSRRGTAELFAKARETNDVVISFRLKLVQDPVEHSFGVILFGPVQGSLDTVSSVVRIQQLLGDATATAAPGSEFYLYNVLDDDDNEFKAPLFLGGLRKSHDSTQILPEIESTSAKRGVFAAFHFHVGGHEYLLVSRPANSYVSETLVTSALFATLTVILSLSAGLLYMFLSGQRVLKAKTRGEAELNEAKWRERVQVETGLNEFLSHEVRNPLSVALSAGRLLEDTLETHKVGEAAKGDVRLINSSLLYMNELLNNMLDVQRLGTAGVIELHPTLCSIKRDVLESVEAMLALRSGVQLICSCDDMLWVTADALRLKQVAMNLAKNAVKFVGSGFIKIEGYRDVARDLVVIAVSDSGPGIPKKFQGRLFTKYETMSHNGGQGSGIGLCLSKSIIDAMHGKIYWDDTYTSGIEGQPGSRFVVELPLKDMSSQAKSNSTAITPEPIADDAFTSMAVVLLVVDDDQLIRTVTVRTLSRMAPHWTFLEAKDGKEGLALAKSRHIDVILVDHYMPPGWTGSDTIKQMREGGVESVIIGLSANEMQSEHLAAGANDFMLKPLDTALLHSKLSTLLSSRAASSCSIAPR